MLGMIILLAFFAIQNVKLSRKEYMGIVFSVLIIISGFFFEQKSSSKLCRPRWDRRTLHTSDGSDKNRNPFSPARKSRRARSSSPRKKFGKKNDDRAPIAENVFVDWFAQLGVLGLLLGLGFLVAVVKNTKPNCWGFFAAVLLMMNLATIFDMTPLAISFFALFAFSQKSEKIHKK